VPRAVANASAKVILKTGWLALIGLFSRLRLPECHMDSLMMAYPLHLMPSDPQGPHRKHSEMESSCGLSTEISGVGWKRGVERATFA